MHRLGRVVREVAHLQPPVMLPGIDHFVLVGGVVEEGGGGRREWWWLYKGGEGERDA